VTSAPDAPEPVLTIQQHLLVREAMPVVDTCAKRVKRRWWVFGHDLDLDDLCTIGKLALYECVPRFRKERNQSFSRFAYLRVTGAMIDDAVADRAEARIVRAIIRAVCFQMADYTDDFNIMQHDREEMQRRVDAMCEAAAAVAFAAGVEEIRRERERDQLADAEEHARAIEALRQVVAELPEEDRRLLDLLYDQGFDQHKAGQILDVTHETVCRRMRKLRESLKRLLKAKGIHAAPPPVDNPPLRATP
jgi:RNA polymerase sigma factor (sigma-70 family)